MKKRYSEEQIIGFLREAESGIPLKELCRLHGFSEASFYLWRSKFGGMSVPDAKRLKALEVENARLKRLLADAMLDNTALKDLLGKNGDARRSAGSGRASPGLPWDERAAGVCCRRSGSHEHAIPLVSSR